MERLTERELNNLGSVAFKNCHQESCDGDCLSCAVQVEVEHKLKRYEDLEEQGLLITLPCKVGDVVYCFDYPSTDIVVVCEDVVEKIEIWETGMSIETGWDIYRANDLGKTVFLTKEEAEQKLKELQNE